MPEKSGCYEIETIGKNGCKSKDDVCITITKDYNIYIPNVFTPNYDGLNDVFLVYGTGIIEIEMNIFDRWGEKLYVSDDQLKGWDGTFKGEECKQDAYTYLIHYKTLDGKKHTKSGHVTLLK
jgi:gliding motility-associated-like protein